MPKKTKEQKELENDMNEENKSIKKSVADKKTTAKKDTSAKTKTTKKASDTTNKKATAKKDAEKKTTTSKNKSTTSTKSSTSKKKTSTTKRATNTKSSTKKTASKRTAKKNIEIVEYYDLPYRYNQTVVKVLAQTPTNLFIYWDISDEDRKSLVNHYGDDFFETTKPVLIVYNDTLNYSFEVELNDFANSWYLHVADSKCDYRIELGRRPIIKTEKLKDDYIYISTSNEIESPNDRILFDQNQKMVYFKNVKTGTQTNKSINNLSFIRNMGKIYDIYDLYKVIYKTENVEEIYDVSNPSS